MTSIGLVYKKFQSTPGYIFLFQKHISPKFYNLLWLMVFGKYFVALQHYNTNLVYFWTPSSIAASSADFEINILSTIVLSCIPSRLLIRSDSSSRRALAQGFGVTMLLLLLLWVVVAWGTPLSSSLAGLAPPTAENECFLRCLSMLCLRVNRRRQISHENGRSPVWVRMCRRKSSADQKRRRQNAHIT